MCQRGSSPSPHWSTFSYQGFILQTWLVKPVKPWLVKPVKPWLVKPLVCELRLQPLLSLEVRAGMNVPHHWSFGGFSGSQLPRKPRASVISLAHKGHSYHQENPQGPGSSVPGTGPVLCVCFLTVIPFWGWGSKLWKAELLAPGHKATGDRVRNVPRAVQSYGFCTFCYTGHMAQSLAVRGRCVQLRQAVSYSDVS